MKPYQVCKLFCTQNYSEKNLFFFFFGIKSVYVFLENDLNDILIFLLFVSTLLIAL